jgi:hypothetical protein
MTAAIPAWRTVSSSSGYFSTALIVWPTTVPDSSAAPKTLTADAQLIASEMPGGLVRSKPRSRLTASATCPASRSPAAGTRRLMISATRSGSG